MNIIRVFWGENFEGSRYRKVWRSDVFPQINRAWTIEQTAFVFGEENAQRLEDAKQPKCKIVLLHKDPFGTADRDWFLEEHNVWIRPWILKWIAIKEAQARLGSIIYCDWDVCCGVRPDQMDLLKELLLSRDLVLSSYKYKRPQYPDRPEEWKRFAASGNWIFVQKGSSVPDWILTRMRKEGKFTWHDELTIGHMLDEWYGGWMGIEKWLTEYESPVMIQNGRRRPWLLTDHPDGTITGDTPIPFVWRKLFWQ